MKYATQGKINFYTPEDQKSFSAIVLQNADGVMVDQRDIFRLSHLTVEWDLRCNSEQACENIVNGALYAKAFSTDGIIKTHLCMDDEGGQCTAWTTVDSWGDLQETGGEV